MTISNNEQLYSDQNGRVVGGAITSDNKYTTNVRVDPVYIGILGSPVVANALAPTFTEGQQTPISSDLQGSLRVRVVSGPAGGTSAVDGSAFTAGSSSFTPSGGVYNDSVAALTSGNQGEVRVTPNRAFHSNLRDNSGNELATSSFPLQVSLANTGSNATPLKIDLSGTASNLSTAPIFVEDVREQFNTYSTSFVGVTTINGLIFDLVGSATKTVYIVHIDLSFGTGTSAAATNITGYITSTAPSGGTASPLTIGKMNSGDPGGTATANTYSGASATPGTTATNVIGIQVNLPANGNFIYSRDFELGQEPQLNGVAQTFSVNGTTNQAVVSGSITWYEK